MARRITGAVRDKVAQLGTIATAIAVVLVALLVAAPVSALALSVPDTSRACKLTLECASGEDAVAGARIELYRVADLDEYGQFSLLDDFAGSGVDISELDRASAWSQAARRLEISAKLAETAPSVATLTSDDGIATFSGLGCGLYLVGTAEGTSASGQTYTSSAFLVSLPGTSSDGQSWVYDISVEPKFEQTSDGSDKKRSDDDTPDNGDSSQGRDSRSGSGSLAGTGDLSPIAAAAGIALVGIALMAAARLNQ